MGGPPAAAAGDEIEETRMAPRTAAGLFCVLALAGVAGVAGAAAPARADPWKDESGHGRRGGWWDDRGRDDRGRDDRGRDDRRHGRDEERRRDRRGGEERYTYDDGECRVEVKRGRNGEVREERHCRGPALYGHGPPAYPYYGPPPPPYGHAPPAPPPRPAPGGRGGWIDPDGS
jgi:hypothetical protein